MAILGNLDLALQDLSPASAARYSIEQAIRATHRATDLTRQMLAYSGKGRFVVLRLDLNELVRENAQLIRTAIARTVTLRLSPTSQPAVIEADPGQVQQVIMNLITNASEAIGKKPGVIALTTGVMACDEKYLSLSRVEQRPTPGRFAYVEVSDTGCGMDDETQQRLFDPFFTTKFMGRGLGMSAVLGIVRGHKGAILVDSAVGRGTTIRALFPEGKAGHAVPTEAHSLSSPEPGLATLSRKVLVVDDEEAVRQLCLKFIRHLGFQGIGAANGEEALALFQQHADEIACVLLDLTMPRLDGARTFAEMKRLRPDVRVILSSGYNEQDAIQRFNEEGLAGFIQKPYRLQELKDKIMEVVFGSG
jgi:CheY-like chemotaxis protein